ncbi:unnamed protein product, partial [marine sediment metagenome]
KTDMKVVIIKNYRELSSKAAQLITEQIIKKRNSVLSLATGSTPNGMYKELIRLNQEGKVDFSEVITFNLDEYYGLSLELTVEVIADGIHIHPIVLKILTKIKEGEKVVLITDAMRAAGLKEGTYDLGGQEVIVAKGQSRLKDGTLAGSVLTMDKAVKNMVNKIGIQLPKAIQMASFNPARSIGVDDKKGSLEPGKDADIVILNKNLETELTIVAGKIVYRRKQI